MVARRRRAFGQHFLADAHVAGRIIRLAALQPGEAVVEIGPGRGALTIPLATRAGRVIAIERDRMLYDALRPVVADFPTVDLRCDDALTYPYATIDRPFKVVANLPYAVAVPLLFRLLEHRRQIPLMVLMLQREVAARLAAGPGSKAYGSLSIAVQYAADVRLAFTVPPGAFRPPPRVDSAVVTVTPRATPRVQVQDEARFFALVRAAFAQRRKTVLNALRAYDETARWRATFAATGIDPTRRAETLNIEEFARLDEARERGTE